MTPPDLSVRNQRIGLLAGWGRFPLIVAETLKRQGAMIYGLGVKDHADPALADLCEQYKQVGVAKLGKAVRFYRQHNISMATMAGKIHKTLLFKKFYLLKHLPDPLFIKTFYPHFITKTRDRKDDTMLGTFVQAFADHGIHFAPATDFAPELLVEHGMIAGRRLSHGQSKDIEFGWQLAAEMGRLDVGQSVAVKGRAVLAVEAVEGTDECIRRAGQLCPAGGFTVIKIAKPQQDMRFDVPTIGVGTLQTMKHAGASVLAVEAHKTILLDRQEAIRFAEKNGIRIVAVHDGNAAELTQKRAA